MIYQDALISLQDVLNDWYDVADSELSTDELAAKKEIRRLILEWAMDFSEEEIE